MPLQTDSANHAKQRGLRRVENDGHALSWQAIGDEMGMTRQAAQQCFKRAVQKVNSNCERLGLNPDDVLALLSEPPEPYWGEKAGASFHRNAW